MPQRDLVRGETLTGGVVSLQEPNPPFWFIWSPRGSAPKRKHATLAEAVTEAVRLSEFFPGRHFYVLEMIGFAMVGPNVPTQKQAERAAVSESP